MNRDVVLASALQIPGWTGKKGLEWLHDTFSESKQHVEIGCHCGRSLLASCFNMAEGSMVYAVEPFLPCASALIRPIIRPGWRRTVFNATLRLIPPGVTVKHMPVLSVQAAMELAAEQVLFDSIYIDANHSYKYILADLLAWLKLLKPGGIIAGHDYSKTFPGVVRAVNEVFGKTRQLVPGTCIWFYRSKEQV